MMNEDNLQQIRKNIQCNSPSMISSMPKILKYVNYRIIHIREHF